MSEDFLPIRVFRQREVDNERVEGRGSTEKPKWVLTGEELAKRSQSLAASLMSCYADVQHNDDLPYVYEVTLDKRDTSKSKRKSVVDMFEIEGADGPSHVIGMRGSKRLLVHAKDDAQIRTLASRIADYDRYDMPLSCIESIERFRPEVERLEGESLYKTRLVDFKADNSVIEQVFEEHLNAHDIAFEKISYAKDLNVYRLHANADQVQVIADGAARETLFYIRPMPRCSVTLDGNVEFALPGVMKPSPGEQYPIVGILDSGIETIAHLAPWINGKRMSPYIDSDLDKSHGTFVAGVASYGDKLEQRNWVGGLPVRLLDAAVFPKDASVDEATLVDSIRTIIDSMHNEVRVWNLSISFNTEVRDDEFSDFGIALDDIQDEYNVLICKSAGNCAVKENGARGRLLVGADSVRALTVGSVAHKKDIHDMADIGNASPFSRKGPGPEYIIKPEISHYGGNAGWTSSGSTRSEVYSFDTNGGPAAAIGTSFSTPRIATLAANLQLALGGEFDPLLIKALIAHSAKFPGDKLVPADEKVQEMGFGVPGNLRQVLSDDPYTATLVLRGVMKKGEQIDILDFPMPQSLVRDGHYTGQIVLTAASAPLLVAGQGGEYCQSDIDVAFGSYDSKKSRDISKPGILNPIGRNDSTNLLLSSCYSAKMLKKAETNFALRERMLIRYKGKYAPMKKYAIDLEDLTLKYKSAVAADRLWYLFLKGTFRDYVEREALKADKVLEQEYCVIISIHDPRRKAELYNEIPQLLTQHNFWHEGIRLSNQVRSMIRRL